MARADLLKKLFSSFKVEIEKHFLELPKKLLKTKEKRIMESLLMN